MSLAAKQRPPTLTRPSTVHSQPPTLQPSSPSPSMILAETFTEALHVEIYCKFGSNFARKLCRQRCFTTLAENELESRRYQRLMAIFIHESSTNI